MRSRKTFACTLQSLDDLRETITAFCAKSGIDAIKTSEIELALNEACTNIVEHGQVTAKDTFTLTLEVTDRVFTATLKDPGRPYDFSRARTVKDGAEISRKRPRSGMGVFIIRQLVDAVLYNRLPDKTNELKLVKNF